jgi:hypothetical protein
LDIYACDGGPVPRCDVKYLTVSVDSNLSPPVITKPDATNNYRDTVVILEDISSTNTVYDIDAIDGDTTVRFVNFSPYNLPALLHKP